MPTFISHVIIFSLWVRNIAQHLSIWCTLGLFFMCVTAVVQLVIDKMLVGADNIMAVDVFLGHVFF